MQLVHGRLAILHVVFFFSGLSALIYQVVWQRMLAAQYGVGPYSIALIVTIFMLGLGFGALVGGWFSERIGALPLAYAIIEFVLGLFGFVSLAFLDALGRVTAGQGYWVAAASAAAFLLLPTSLMGATLPILVKYCNALSSSFLGTISRLYWANTLGAAFGALMTSYLLLSVWDMDVAIDTAVGVNIALAFLVLLLFGPGETASVPSVRRPTRTAEDAVFLGTVALPIGLVTGFLAIGYQIVWYEVLTVLLRSSPYVFSTTLATYLFGIATGSALIYRFMGRIPIAQRKVVFFAIQVLIALSVAALFAAMAYSGTLHALKELTFSHELHPPVVWFLSGFDWRPYETAAGAFHLFDVFFWPALLVFLPTLLMGASFPLAAYLYVGEGEHEGAGTGIYYLANVLGNVAGAFVTGFVLIPWVGANVTTLWFCAVGLLFGLGCTLRHSRLATAGGCAAVAIALMALFEFFPRNWVVYPPDGAEVNGVKYLVDEGPDGIVKSTI